MLCKKNKKQLNVLPTGELWRTSANFGELHILQTLFTESCQQRQIVDDLDELPSGPPATTHATNDLAQIFNTKGTPLNHGQQRRWDAFKTNKKKKVIYARVSSAKQKDDLQPTPNPRPPKGVSQPHRYQRNCQWPQLQVENLSFPSGMR